MMYTITTECVAMKGEVHPSSQLGGLYGQNIAALTSLSMRMPTVLVLLLEQLSL